MAWMTTGMLRMGKTKPERRKVGTRVSIALARKAICWVGATVEIRMPRARQAKTKSDRHQGEREDGALDGYAEEEGAGPQDTRAAETRPIVA